MRPSSARRPWCCWSDLIRSEKQLLSSILYSVQVQANFNSGSLVVCARCCSLNTVACIRETSCPSLGLSEVSAQVPPRPQVPGPAHRPRADDGPVHGRHVRRGRPDDSGERVDRGTEFALSRVAARGQRLFISFRGQSLCRTSPRTPVADRHAGRVKWREAAGPAALRF